MENKLEKAAEVYANKKGDIPTTKLEDAIFKQGFIDGSKWQQERMYNNMQEYAEFCIRCYEKQLPCIIAKDWFEQFKKK